MVAVTLLQFTELTLLVFGCKFQPVEGDGQETATVLVAVGLMVSHAAFAGRILNREATPASATALA